MQRDEQCQPDAEDDQGNEEMAIGKDRGGSGWLCHWRILAAYLGVLTILAQRGWSDEDHCQGMCG